jgi:hypothetical protein
VRTVTVIDPAHVTWDVRVVWAPRHRALVRRIGGWRKRKDRDGPGSSDSGSGWDLPTMWGDDFLFWIFVALLAVVVAALLLWWVVIPLLLLVLDGLIVFVLLVLGIGGRILVRRPWTVEASSPGETHQLKVVGWRRALRARDGVAEGLRMRGPASWPTLTAEQWD